jgi:hypothetical protein
MAFAFVALALPGRGRLCCLHPHSEFRLLRPACLLLHRSLRPSALLHRSLRPSTLLHRSLRPSTLLHRSLRSRIEGVGPRIHGSRPRVQRGLRAPLGVQLELLALLLLLLLLWLTLLHDDREFGCGCLTRDERRGKGERK